MKRILGAAAGVLLWVSACGDDATTAESPATGGKSIKVPEEMGGGGAGGDAGQPVPTPVGGGGASTDEGGAPTELAGAGMGGAGGAPEALSDVSGHITAFRGKPLANVVVIINDASTVTDEAGAFTIEGVPATYDLTAIDNERKFIQVVERLTTREPRVGFYQMRVDGRSGGVAGKLSGGGGFPLPVGQAGLVSYRGDRSFSQVELEASATSFSLSNISWGGKASQTGLLTGIVWKTGLSGPTEYTGYAQRSVTLEADKTVGNINGSVAATNLALTDPAEHTVTGTLAVAGKPTSVSSNLVLGGNYIPLSLEPGAISVVVPEVESTTEVAVQAQFDALGSSSISVPFSGNAAVDVELPLPPQLVLPIEGAVGVTLATEFSWKAPPAGTYSLISWGIGDWFVVRVTTSSKVKLPDLSAAGVVYAEGNYTPSWQLDQFGPATSPEEALQLFDGTSPSYGTVVTTFGSNGREFHFAE